MIQKNFFRDNNLDTILRIGYHIAFSYLGEWKKKYCKMVLSWEGSIDLESIHKMDNFHMDVNSFLILHQPLVNHCVSHWSIKVGVICSDMQQLSWALGGNNLYHQLPLNAKG